jgi:pyrroloquinoline quinone biosynthesis protein E
MQEPCRSCERRDLDWGGCRCQAMAISGDAAATDPACVKSPLHARMAMLIDAAMAEARRDRDENFVWRRIGVAPAGTEPALAD